LRSLSTFKLPIEGNVRILAFRGLVLTISGGLAGGLSALYIKEVLGADGTILGLFSSIWSAVFLAFVFVGGWFGDRYDRKKMLLVGTAFTLPNPVIYFLARSWHPILIANFFGALGSAFANPAYTGILFSSVEQDRRSRAMATINSLMGLANVVFPPLGAYLIELMGGLAEVRNMFVLQFVFSLGVWLYTLKALEPMAVNTQEESVGLNDAIRNIFGQVADVYRLAGERKATSWLHMSLTGPFAWELVGPFWTIYAAEVCGSPLIVIGLLSTVGSITSIMLQFPLARISDRKGRKRAILMLRPFRYMCIIALLIGGSYNLVFAPFIPLFAWILDAVGNSIGPSWSSAQTEVMPEDVQSRWNALLSFLWRVTAVPAALIGGLLWNIDPRLPFIIALAVDGIVRYPILIRNVPETLVPPGHEIPPLGSNVVIYGLPEAGRTSTARLVQRNMCVGEVCPRILDERSERITGVPATTKETLIIEGKNAVFAAAKADESVRVLLVASKDERVRRKVEGSRKPRFVALREVEEEDREANKLSRRLYGADMSKLPPFDVAINTDRVPPELVAKIVALIQEAEEEKDSSS